MLYPKKPAPVDHGILDAMIQRWSPRTFSSTPVEAEKIATFFEAARWAPSSYNEQPWHYIYAGKEGAGRAELESLLTPGNAWAKSAPILMMSFTKKTFAKNGKENRHAMHDVGAASGYLVLQLPSLGLIGHQMSGFAWEKANAMLGVPEEYVPGSMIAVGYPADPRTDDSEELKKDEEKVRVRKPQSEFVHREHW